MLSALECDDYLVMASTMVLISNDDDDRYDGTVFVHDIFSLELSQQGKQAAGNEKNDRYDGCPEVRSQNPSNNPHYGMASGSSIRM